MTGHLNIGMPQHFSNTLNGNTICQSKRCESMTGHMGNYQQSNTKQNGELITQAVSNEQIFNIWNNPQKRILGKY